MIGLSPLRDATEAVYVRIGRSHEFRWDDWLESAVSFIHEREYKRIRAAARASWARRSADAPLSAFDIEEWEWLVYEAIVS